MRSSRRRTVLLFVMGFFFALLASRRAGAAAPELDLASPRATLEAFQTAAIRGDFVRAAATLDLHLVRGADRAERGPDLAQKLYVVMERTVWLDLDSVPDEATMKKEEGSYRAATIPLDDEHNVPITLVRATGGEGRWLISSATVTRIPELYERYGPGLVEGFLPQSIARPRLGWLALWQWAGLLIALLCAVAAARLVSAVLEPVVDRVTRRTAAKWDDELAVRLRGPARLFIMLAMYRVLLEPLTLPAAAVGTLGTALKVAFVAVMAFAAVRVVAVVASTIEARALLTSTSGEDRMSMELRARGLTTQVRVLHRVVNIAIGLLSVALMLMQFEVVRSVGVSLLASAGLAGVVLGFAAQRTIGTLVAGIQLSVTQPIRIGDQVVVEKESGIIEEITLTYVVVRLWDERRMIVPMTRFLEQPFENWTKVGKDLHGTVFLRADPALPMNLLRAELDRIITEAPQWDGRTKAVHVFETNERAIDIRILVSARDASKLFDLRAFLRERLVAWLATFEDGRYLPMTRTEEIRAKP